MISDVKLAIIHWRIRWKSHLAWNWQSSDGNVFSRLSWVTDIDYVTTLRGNDQLSRKMLVVPRDLSLLTIKITRQRLTITDKYETKIQNNPKNCLLFPLISPPYWQCLEWPEPRFTCDLHFCPSPVSRSSHVSASSSPLLANTNMSHLLLLGKYEYSGGPIFKVVLEC